MPFRKVKYLKEYDALFADAARADPASSTSSMAPMPHSHMAQMSSRFGGGQHVNGGSFLELDRDAVDPYGSMSRSHSRSSSFKKGSHHHTMSMSMMHHRPHESGSSLSLLELDTRHRLHERAVPRTSRLGRLSVKSRRGVSGGKSLAGSGTAAGGERKSRRARPVTVPQGPAVISHTATHDDKTKSSAGPSPSASSSGPGARAISPGAAYSAAPLAEPQSPMLSPWDSAPPPPPPPPPPSYGGGLSPYPYSYPMQMHGQPQLQGGSSMSRAER